MKNTYISIFLFVALIIGLYFLNNKEYGNENDDSTVIYIELNNYIYVVGGILPMKIIFRKGEDMLDFKVKIGLVPIVRDLFDFATRKGIFEPAKGVENKDKVSREPGQMVNDVPLEIDQDVASRKLAFWGCEIDVLTPEQHRYLFGE